MERNLLFREISRNTQPVFEQFVSLHPAALPPSLAGRTVYLPVSLGGTLPAKTGIYFPPGFKPAQNAVRVVVYFHGMIIKDCQTLAAEFHKKGIEYYWDTPLFRCLRDDFQPQDTHALLIAPTIKTVFGHKQGSPADYGHLNRAFQFDKFIQSCFRELKNAGHLPSNAEPGNIILAGHSAGGLPMQSILMARNDLGKKIVACLGFDSHYYSSTPYLKWLGKNPDKSYYHFGALNAGGGKSRPWVNADALSKKLPNAHSIPVPAGQKLYHCGIVRYWWGKTMPTQP